MANLSPKVEKIEDKLDIDVLFIDEDEIFDADKKCILDLIDKTDFSHKGNICFMKGNDEEMKPVTKNEKKEDFKTEDILLT